MSREILFKGKRIDNGEWVEGGTYLYDPDLENVCIGGYDYYKTEDGWQREEYCCEVDSETVCEYTGLTDKNGRKIFEGDIVNCHEKRGAAFWHCKVVWNEKNARFDVENKDCGFPMCLDGYGSDFIRGTDYEVIGNIFDNAELLKGAGGNEYE